MTTMASIAELQSAGVRLEADDAVAIAQQLIRSFRHDEGRSVEPPFGPPTAANVFLNEDGSVTCRGCDTAPAVFDVAIFLDALLPASPRVPGGLRYAIARAMLAVDVAPFDSLEEFSEALAKYETGSREDVVRQLLERSSSPRIAPAPDKDRREPRASVTELRRALREADARLYEQRIVRSASAGSSQAPPGRTLLAAAACVAVGVLLFASGEFMHSRRAQPAVLTPPPAVVAPPPETVGTSGSTTPAAAMPLTPEPASVRASTLSPAVHTPVPQSSAKPSSKRAKAKPAARASARPSVRRGVLDRLHMRWLRFRDDL
jgi:hypothetical protein